MYLLNPIRPNSIYTDNIVNGAVTEVKTDFDTNPLSIAGGGTGTASPALSAGTGIQITGSWPNQTIVNSSAYATLSDPLPIAHGGTGKTSATLSAGTGIQITGSWPDQTVVNTSAFATLSDPLPVVHGGTGLTAPSLVAGNQMVLSGSWPNQTLGLSSTPQLGVTDLAGNSTITSNPPTGSTNSGWKITLYGNQWAIGLASQTMSFLCNAWVSIFSSALLPANDATLSTPDSNAKVSLGKDGSVRAQSAILTTPLAVGYGGTGASDLPTAGIPSKVYHNELTGQTAATGVTTIYNPSAAGMYRLSGMLILHSGSSTNATATLQVLFTIGGLSYTVTLGNCQATAASENIASGASEPFYVDSASNIQFNVVITNFSSSSFDVYLLLERLS